MKHLSRYIVPGLVVVAVVAITVSVGADWWDKNVQVSASGYKIDSRDYRLCPRCSNRVYTKAVHYQCNKCSYNNHDQP